MTKTEAQKQVRAFCRQHGVAVNGTQGIPLLSKGEWLYCANDWLDAHEFLMVAYENFRFESKPYPWANQ